MRTLEKKPKMFRVVIYLTPEMTVQVDARANKSGISRSEVIRHDILTAAQIREMRIQAA